MSTKLTLLSLLICGNLFSQTSPLVVVSSTGKFNYIGEAKKNVPVSNGALLSSNGKLNVKEKSSVVLLCNDGFNVIKKGNYNLSSLCGGTETFTSAGFDATFSNDVLSAVELTYLLENQSPAWSKLKDPANNAGDGWGAKDRGGWGAKDRGGWGSGDRGGWGAKDRGGWGAKDRGGWGAKDRGGWGAKDRGGWGEENNDAWGAKDRGGWGGKGNSIALIMPIGLVPSNKVQFKWSKPNNSGTYAVIIKDANNTIVDSVISKDTFVIIDLSKPIYDTDDRFTWSVKTLNNSIQISSESFEFGTISEDPQMKINKLLKKSKIYKNLDPYSKMLMEASAYEQEQLFYNASQIYSEIRKKDPKNKLARMMSSSFWVRGGMIVMAEDSVEK